MQHTILFPREGNERQLLHGAERLPLTDADLFYFPACYDTAESANLMRVLLQETPWRQDSVSFGGKPIPVPRLQAWYGDSASRYGYSGLKLTPLAWTPTLTAIRAKLEALLSLRFNSVLLNYYRDGQDSVAWHSDDERELGPDPRIASLSLGAQRRFELRHRQREQRGKYKLMLGDGSLLLMGSGLQKNWLHQLPKDPAITAPRLNLTFRFIH